MITLKRKAIADALINLKTTKPILLPYSKEELIELFFDEVEDETGNNFYKINDIMKKVISKIDFSNVPFDNVNVTNIDFSGSCGVKINPQTIYAKNLSGAKLNGVEFIGNNTVNEIDLFEGVKVSNTNFAGSKGARINPQTIYEKNLSHCLLTDVDFTGFTFDGANLCDTDFTGSKGARINPNLVKNASYTSFNHVELLDLPEEVYNYNRYSLSNYSKLIDAKILYQNQFLGLIKDQLPPIEENPLEVVEASQNKQKRKWFGN